MLYLATKLQLQRGSYDVKPIPAEMAGAEIRQASESGRLESAVGFANTAEMLERISGVEVPVNGRRYTLADGDKVLFLQPNVLIKGEEMRLKPSYFKFFLCAYRG